MRGQERLVSREVEEEEEEEEESMADCVCGVPTVVWTRQQLLYSTTNPLSIISSLPG